MKNSDTNMTGVLVRKGIWGTEIQTDGHWGHGGKTASTHQGEGPQEGQALLTT